MHFFRICASSLLLFIACFSCAASREGGDQKISGPLRSPLIYIDAGHGGKDYGASSHSKPRYHEKYLNLTTALLVREHLQQLGYRTALTRSDDTFIPLPKRSKLANESPAILFVSIHYNHAPNIEAQGMEVFYYSSEKDGERSAESKKLADHILRHMLDVTKTKDRGVKHANFSVLRNTEIPAVLVEGGFMSNDEEMEKLREPKYLHRIAWGIAKGVDTYLEQSSF